MNRGKSPLTKVKITRLSTIKESQASLLQRNCESSLSSQLTKASHDSFRLSPYSVIIGRGKKCQGYVGNRRLEVLAKSVLAQYAEATGRSQKSTVVSYVIRCVKEAGGTFFKLTDDGTFLQADNNAAREKVGVVLRNLLSHKYRSSCKAKVKARRVKIQKEREQMAPNRAGPAVHETTPTNLPGEQALQKSSSAEMSFAETSGSEHDPLKTLLSFNSILKLPGDEGDDASVHSVEAVEKDFYFFEHVGNENDCNAGSTSNPSDCG